MFLLGFRDRASTPGDRHQVVVHVAAEALAENVSAETRPANVPAETSPAKVAAETPLHPETVRRLACDGGLLTIVEKDNGDPLNVGRKTRAIPPSTRRESDGTFRFMKPGFANLLVPV